MPDKLPPLGPKTLRLTRSAEGDFDDIIDYIEAEAGGELPVGLPMPLMPN